MRWKEARRPSTTIVDLPFTAISGGQPYSPHRLRRKNLIGTITLRRALAGSRNVPA